MKNNQDEILFSSTENKLKDFKSNNLKTEDLSYYLAFQSIYFFNQNATDEEIITIADRGYDAWLKDEIGYGITKFTDFIAEHYFNDELTLNDIANAKTRDILSDAIDDCLYYIKLGKEEMER